MLIPALADELSAMTVGLAEFTAAGATGMYRSSLLVLGATAVVNSISIAPAAVDCKFNILAVRGA